MKLVLTAVRALIMAQTAMHEAIHILGFTRVTTMLAGMPTRT